MAKDVYVITDKVYNELRKQTSFNKMVTLFCVISTFYILRVEERNRKNEQRIDALNSEIEQLKNQKGE